VGCMELSRLTHLKLEVAVWEEAKTAAMWPAAHALRGWRNEDSVVLPLR